MKRTIIIAGFLIGTLVFMFILVTRVKRGVSYHENGQLRHEVTLKNGLPEGLSVNYYPSGAIMSKAYWRNGKKHGPATSYYEDGKIRQESYFERGICQVATDYHNEGRKMQITYFDSLERYFDYVRFQPNGERDYSPESKRVLFLPLKDTVRKGEEYVAAIRLGNRQFDWIEVILGDLDDPEMPLKNPPLPMKDSLTAIVRVKADSTGLRLLTGIVIERSSQSDSLAVTAFEHKYFVIE